MPRVDVSNWDGDAVAEQVERLSAQGAEPKVVRTLSWKSAAERRQDAQDAQDEAYLSTLRAGAVKGANRIRHQR